MRRRLVLLLTTGAAALSASAAGAPSATASRSATPAEAAAVSAVYGSTPECSKVVVANVSRDFARWDYREPYPASCPQDRGNGFGIAVRSPTTGKWFDAYQASDNSAICSDKGVYLPAAVGTDLRACRTLSSLPVRIECYPGAGDGVRRSKPTACTLLPPTASFGTGANLAGLSWRNWGKPTATATGREKGFHLPFQRIPARVTAYRLRPDTCGFSVRLYTRVKVTTRYGSVIVKLPDCSQNGD